MPSHFSSIGLPVRSSEDFVAFAERVADDCETIDVPNGRYLRWSSASGAELWLQLDNDNNLIGMNPHFSGKSVVRVGLTSRIRRPDGTALDGAFHGWADPSEKGPESGTYPFVFDSPDFDCWSLTRIPAIVKVQIAAFAHELSVFASEEAYDDSQTSGMKFASQSFIPSGLFSSGGQTTDPPEALGIFTGIVRQTEIRTNELTDEIFHWALVESLGGCFDVVIDPELLNEAPRKDGVLSGSFWLSGRLSQERSGSPKQ